MVDLPKDVMTEEIDYSDQDIEMSLRVTSLRGANSGRWLWLQSHRGSDPSRIYAGGGVTSPGFRRTEELAEKMQSR